MTTTTLEKFIDLFPDEASLREVLVFLWSHVPGVTGVRQLHSGLEHGKDIVFFYQGPAGEAMLCACVVKNEKISGYIGLGKLARWRYDRRQPSAPGVG